MQASRKAMRIESRSFLASTFVAVDNNCNTIHVDKDNATQHNTATIGSITDRLSYLLTCSFDHMPKRTSSTTSAAAAGGVAAAPDEKAVQESQSSPLSTSPWTIEHIDRYAAIGEDQDKLLEGFDALKKDQQDIKQAWQDYRAAVQKNKDNAVPAIDLERVQADYLNKATDAFVKDFETLQNQPDVDVDILVECLQSGYDGLTTKEQQWYWEAMLEDERGQSAEGDNEAITPHERRRRFMGYDKQYEA
jgi:hypothetical protein